MTSRIDLPADAWSEKWLEADETTPGLWWLCRMQPKGPFRIRALSGKFSLDNVEQYRMQMAGISTAAMGYWKEGDSIHPDYDTIALRDVAKLYAKYEALSAAPPVEGGEAVAWMISDPAGDLAEPYQLGVGEVERLRGDLLQATNLELKGNPYIAHRKKQINALCDAAKAAALRTPAPSAQVGWKPEAADLLCRADGRCQYAIDHGAEGMGHCPAGQCCTPRIAHYVEVGREWAENSSLEKWFPFTAEELAKLREEVRLLHETNRCAQVKRSEAEGALPVPGEVKINAAPQEKREDAHRADGDGALPESDSPAGAAPTEPPLAGAKGVGE